MMRKFHYPTDVKENKVICIGRYTIVHLIDKKGVEAIGISRRSPFDKPSNLGKSIARGRAELCLNMKRRKVHPSQQHWYMG